MASNDYYRDNNTSSSRPQYTPYDAAPSSSHYPTSTYPPSYSSRPGGGGAGGASATHQNNPFDTPFDDHVYPSKTHQSNDALNSQHSFAQDTRYHGGDVSPVGDDIPLRPQHERSHKNGTPALGTTDTDHVYDTTHSARRGSQRESQQDSGAKGGLRFGELGMIGSQKRRIPIFVYLFSVVQIAVFIVELVKAAQLTGTPIQTQPQFNPMIGPSQQVMINMGSRFVLCMHDVPNVSTIQKRIPWQCPNSTTLDWSDKNNQCTLAELCGFGAVDDPANPNKAFNQWWRFIIPMFMHAGIVHIGFNLLLQLTIGKEIERAIGSIRFFLVYVSAGIFGFIMGGNFAAPAISSTGASGSLFGIIALTLLDLLYSWKERRRPVRELMFIIVEILISFVLGLLPGLDNFSHIGGFLMGLCLGICVLHSPNVLRARIGEDHFTSYSTVPHGGINSVAFPPFFRNPVGFFKGRKSLWWAWWLVRAAFLIAIIVVFIVLLNNFYVNYQVCGWCKYLSCLNINGWCELGNFNITNTKRAERGVEAFEQMAKLYYD